MFYTYAYLREDGTPYYIGKGKGNRINAVHRFKLPPKNRRLVLKNDLTEEQALQHEVYMISVLPNLRNLTAGGEGISGWKHTEEAVNKMKEKRATQVITPEMREKFRQNTLRRHREGDLGSSENREKLSQSLCKKHYIVMSPSGETYYTNNVVKFSKEHNLDHSSMYKVVRGQLKGYKGWWINNNQCEVQK